MIKIDYIIPVYRESQVVKRALDILAKQTMKDSLCITLVNDCSPNTDCGYQDVINEYKDKLDIRVIKTPENIGTGMARQFGIDNTSNKYIMSQDDDDILASDDVIEKFIRKIEEADDSVRSIVGGWKEILSDGTVITEQSGKELCTCIVRLIYRSLLDEHNIRFDSDMSMVFEDKNFGMKFLYILKNHGYTELDIEYNHYIYIRDNSYSTTNNIGVYKTDLYHAVNAFKTYEFRKEQGESEESLWGLLNSAFELSFFSIIRNISSIEITKHDLETLRKEIKNNYEYLNGEYEIQKDSTIYTLQKMEILNDIDDNYEKFISNPLSLVDALMEKIMSR